MVKIIFTKPYLKPHTTHSITIIEYDLKAFIKKLKTRGYEIVEIQRDV